MAAVLRTVAVRHPNGLGRGELISMVDAVERVRLTRPEGDAAVAELVQSGHLREDGDALHLTENILKQMPDNTMGPAWFSANLVKLLGIQGLHSRPMRRLTLGEADKQAGQYEDAGDNSYGISVVKALAGLAAYPWALDRRVL